MGCSLCLFELNGKHRLVDITIGLEGYEEGTEDFILYL
jgi:hypothetical protein